MADKFKYEVKAKQNRQMLPAEQSKLLFNRHRLWSGRAVRAESLSQKVVWSENIASDLRQLSS